MSNFTKKLKEIKKETFRLTDFYIQELIDLFDYNNNEDKNFILGNNKKSTYYENDILQLLKALLKENDKLKGFENDIIENYKNKYLSGNSLIKRTYCLVYLELFINLFKTYDYRLLFRELYNKTYEDLIENFSDIFLLIEDKEYFIKSFNIYLNNETLYGNKYFSKNEINFLLNLDKKYFIDFIDGLSSDGLVYLKELDKDEVDNFIEKIILFQDFSINIKLKNLFLENINKLKDGELDNYDYKQIISSFVKSYFATKLLSYLGNIYNELSLDIINEKGDIFYSLWEIVGIISIIIRKENIKEICKKLHDNFICVYIYESIEGGNRSNKNELLYEFKKYKSFNIKHNERILISEKYKIEDEEKNNKKREDFNAGISVIIDEEKNNPIGINEYLLYHYDENTFSLKENIKVVKVIKKQIKRFFKLPASNPDVYELNFTKKDQNGSSYTTHQFVVNNTFIRCLKFYKDFKFTINDTIIKKAISYIPYAYSNDLEYIFSFIGDIELEKENVDYLLSIYDGTRTKDDLKYNNVSSFLLFYEKYKNSFIKYSKVETQKTFLNIINDINYSGYERKYTTEKFADIGNEEQLLELFIKYKTDENYFSNIENQDIKIAIISSNSLIMKFSNTINKKLIIDWYIKQLKVKVSLYVKNGDGMRGISGLESEISWNLTEEKSFISIFKYINDLSFENEIRKLLDYSFKIIEESKKDYRLFGNYIHQAVYNFYEGIEKKNLKIIFELEKEVIEKIIDDEIKISFKVNFLDKLINIYSENIDKLNLNKIYESVYKLKKDNSKENEKLKEELTFLRKDKLKLESLLMFEKKEKLQLEDVLNKYKGNEKEKDESIILFVEGKTDKRYLEAAYKEIFKKDFPYIIVNLYGQNALRNCLTDLESLKYTYPNTFTFIGLFDFDSAYSSYDGIKTGFDKLPNYKMSNINDIFRAAFLLPTSNIHDDIKKNIFKNGNEIEGNFGDKSEFEIEHLFYGINNEIDKQFTYKDVIGGGKILSLIGDKLKFCNYIIGSEPKKLGIQDKIFNNFIPIFKLIDEIVEKSKNITPKE